MVLESLVVPEKMECHPSQMLIIGFLYASIGIYLGFAVFKSYASISSVFLTAMPLIVVMYRTLRYEEGKDCRINGEFMLMKEHLHVFNFFIYLFIGLVIAFTFWYSFLPEEMGATISESQMETLQFVKNNVATGNMVNDHDFLMLIFKNNLKVWGFCIIFSFLYGAGAIFILTWNASVLAAALTKYFSLHYFIHGIPEVLAYFMAALAGGIISVAVANHDFNSKKFLKIIVDSIDLIILSLITLGASAIIEVYQVDFLIWFGHLFGV